MPAKTKQPVDAIDNYFPDGDDFEDPFASPANSPTQSPKFKTKRKEPDEGLGIDEEVSVAKRARVPRVKLDETRLLSDKGIPALRKRAGQLKLKGKGHEFSDAARLLSFYQLWLDDLFPKAKFLDALAMVEKAGHKTIMHKNRTDWINEARPQPVDGDEDKDPNAAVEPAGAPAREPTRIAPIFEKRLGATGATSGIAEELFGDEFRDMYDATPEPDGTRTGGAPITGEEPDDGDLDALMAEAEAESRPGPPRSNPVGAAAPASKTAVRSLFGSGKPAGPTTNGRGGGGDGAPDDDDDLDALMAEAEASAVVGVGTNRGKTVVGGAGEEEDDLDALMAEAESYGKPAGNSSGKSAATAGQGGAPEPEFGDDEEAMAELDGLW